MPVMTAIHVPIPPAAGNAVQQPAHGSKKVRDCLGLPPPSHCLSQVNPKKQISQATSANWKPATNGQAILVISKFLPYLSIAEHEVVRFIGPLPTSCKHPCCRVHSAAWGAARHPVQKQVAKDDKELPPSNDKDDALKDHPVGKKSRLFKPIMSDEGDDDNGEIHYGKKPSWNNKSDSERGDNDEGGEEEGDEDQGQNDGMDYNSGGEDEQYGDEYADNLARDILADHGRLDVQCTAESRKGKFFFSSPFTPFNQSYLQNFRSPVMKGYVFDFKSSSY